MLKQIQCQIDKQGQKRGSFEPKRIIKIAFLYGGKRYEHEGNEQRNKPRNYK